MRIVVDYRPALRARTGVGEYIHQGISALIRGGGGDAVTLFSSSWRDRVPTDLAAQFPRTRIVDRRIPVRALNLAWHRLEWPPIEMLADGAYDVAHSPHPLMMPSRSAARIVTIHDLHFLTHPERSWREIRRDYPALAREHARRADGIVVSSQFAAGEVQRTFELPAARIAVCPAGTPSWARDLDGGRPDGHLLFVGTLSARKNVAGLIEAYRRLIDRVATVPRLVIAGTQTEETAAVVDTLSHPPFLGRVQVLGFVSDADRAELFRRAAVFVLPSFEEGFGLPALEAMAAGVPVVASNRGSLPEVIGDAGILVDPDDVDALAGAVKTALADGGIWQALRSRGLERSKRFTWEQTAAALRRAYDAAIEQRRQRRTDAHRH